MTADNGFTSFSFLVVILFGLSIIGLVWFIIALIRKLKHQKLAAIVADKSY